MANLIYIGNLADIDTDDSNYTNENPDAIKGTYTHQDMDNVTVTMSNNWDPNYTYDNDVYGPGDTFTYDLGSGSVTSELDSSARYEATITDQNGVQHSVTISGYQTVNGDTFIRLPDGYQINEITIGSMVGDGYDGVTYDVSSSSTVVCYCAGTVIDTQAGPVAIENLAVGDKVWTQDHGYQRITWIENWITKCTAKTAPIEIEAGALGPNTPNMTLRVSRQHRLYLGSKIVERMFDAPGVLMPAHLLVGLPGVRQNRPVGSVQYYHFTCPNHEIVRANGMLTESLLPAKEARKALTRLAGTECHDLILRQGQPKPARPITQGKRGRNVVRRHLANAVSFHAPAA